MKKNIFIASLTCLLIASFCSCTTMKRDCQGRRHEKLKNGVYI